MSAKRSHGAQFKSPMGGGAKSNRLTVLAAEISRAHCAGDNPWRPLGDGSHSIVADLRLRRLVMHLHKLGPRPLAEFLQELAGKDDEAAVAITANLERYGVLDAGVVKAVGGREFPPVPIHEAW